MASADNIQRILLISDIHFDAKKNTKKEGYLDKSGAVRSFKALIRFFKRNSAPKVDVVIVNGDIAQSGSVEDYKLAKKWFKKLMKLETIPNPQGFIFSAGNHDAFRPALFDFVDNYLPSEIEKTDLDGVQSQEIVKMSVIKRKSKLRPENIEKRNAVLSFDNEKNLEICKAFDPYIDFLQDLNIPMLENHYADSLIAELKSKPLSPEKKNEQKEKYRMLKYLCGYRELQGVNFVVFNSSWYCYGNDRDLVLGKEFVHAITTKIEEKKKKKDTPAIACMHHGMNSLAWSETHTDNTEFSCNVNKILQSSNIILTGHQHSREITHPTSYQSKCLYLEGGCMYEAIQNERNSFKILEINLEKEEVSVDYYTSRKESRGYVWQQTDNEVSRNTYGFDGSIVSRKTKEEIFWEENHDLMRNYDIYSPKNIKDIEKFIISSFEKDFCTEKFDSLDYQNNESVRAYESSKILIIPLNILDSQSLQSFEEVKDDFNSNNQFKILMPYFLVTMKGVEIRDVDWVREIERQLHMKYSENFVIHPVQRTTIKEIKHKMKSHFPENSLRAYRA